MRGGGVFSDEEIQLLRGLPAVANVTRNRITYSDAFKQVCTIRYLAGESPTKIFREAGLPPDLVGYKRIERSVARWKAAAIKSVSGNDHLDDSEIIAQLVERYKRTLVTRRNLDNMASGVPDSSVPVMSEGAVGAHVSIGALDGDTAGIIIKQARDMGITARIMAGDTWENATIMENAGVENCEGVALSTFFDENDADASEFVQGFKAYLNSDAEALKLNGNNDTVAAVSALGYDAYMAIIEALKNVSGDITGEAVRDALASVSFDGVTGGISFD